VVVVYGSKYSHKYMNVNKIGIPTTKHFFKGGKCETFKGANFVQQNLPNSSPQGD